MPETAGGPARMGVGFPMAEFEWRAMADPEVLGMMYCGSLGRGGNDSYSDLDITLWMPDEALERPGLLEHYLGWLGEVKFITWERGEHGLSCNSYVGPDWQSVELGIMGSHHPEPHPYHHGVRVLKDTDGRLAALVAASGPPTFTLTRAVARQMAEEVLYHVGFVTSQNLRGSRYHAMGNLAELTGTAYALLARSRGLESYAVRFAEQFLSAEELALLYAAWPASPDRDDVRRAVRGLLAWALYAAAEAERALGEPLGIALDADAYLEAIERPYAWGGE